MNRILPDFKEWSRAVLDRSELAEALEQAYNQGYYAGRVDQEAEWWQHQDDVQVINDCKKDS